jgi:transcriptional regulator with XRE-family HTH domain
LSENFRLRAALTKAGMLPDDLADRAEVDIKTVGRWLGGRTPHPRFRARVAHALDTDELELWPEAKPTRTTEDPFKEIAGAWTSSGDPSAPDWTSMLNATGEQIDLLDLTHHGLLTPPGIVEKLAAQATRGAQLRILIAAAGSIYLTVHDQELGREPDPDGRPVSEREREETLKALAPLASQPRVEVREFVAAVPHTILRFDDELLTILRLHGLDRSQAPLLHVRRRQDDGLFDQLTAHFDRTWNTAAEQLEPDNDPGEPDDEAQPDHQEPPPAERTTKASGPPSPQQAQEALERLRARPMR